MKRILTMLAFTTIIFAIGCGNDSAKKDDGTLDSIGNPSTNPSSTSVLTDSSTINSGDTMHTDTLSK